MRKTVLVSFVALWLATTASAEELHRIRMVNRWFGAVSVSRDGGASWLPLCRVARPLSGQYKAIQDREFTASDWAKVGCVAATAVNAIHVKVAQLEPHAAVFSILPGRLGSQGAQLKSYFDEPSSLFLDLEPAAGLFGPEWSPTVNSPLFLEDPYTRALTPWPPGHAPALGDRVVIVVLRDEPRLQRLTFENRFGGRVTAEYADGASRLVAQVLRPVTGCGRFGGSIYVDNGLLRANHPGVICVSTSPVGQEGGIQIVPSVHASHPDLDYVRSTSAWVVVGPASPEAPGLEGTPPLFSGSLRPGAWRMSVRRRASGEAWLPCPVAAGKNLGALIDVTDFRLEADAAR